MAGSTSSEGELTRSVDGRYLVMAGYAADAGTLAVAGTAAAATRLVCRVDGSGNLDLTTRLTNAFSGSNVRGAASVDGTAFWVSGTSSPAGDGGVHYALLGAASSTRLISTPDNMRHVNIFDNQLYATSGSSPFVNVVTVGSGLPTTGGQTVTLLPGLDGGAGRSPYSFAGLNTDATAGADTLYVCDDGAIASGGGVVKYILVGGTWTYVTTFTTGITSGCRGLAALRQGTLNIIIVSTAENPTRVVRFDDDGTTIPTAVPLSSAPTNTAYRGVALSP
ncbi:MAG: hypothetical protein IPJ65_01220 [Archangiaceae bacterium]|nr:hypothetical protein [Archangiaceae bacterium]